MLSRIAALFVSPPVPYARAAAIGPIALCYPSGEVRVVAPLGPNDRLVLDRDTILIYRDAATAPDELMTLDKRYAVRHFDSVKRQFLQGTTNESSFGGMKWIVAAVVLFSLYQCSGRVQAPAPTPFAATASDSSAFQRGYSAADASAQISSPVPSEATATSESNSVDLTQSQSCTY